MKDKKRRQAPFKEILKLSAPKSDKPVQKPADSPPQPQQPSQPKSSNPAPKAPQPPQDERPRYQPHPPEEAPKKSRKFTVAALLLALVILIAVGMIFGASVFHHSYTNRDRATKAQTESEKLAALDAQIQLLQTKLDTLENPPAAASESKNQGADKTDEGGKGRKSSGETAEAQTPRMPSTPQTPPPPPVIPKLPDISPVSGSGGLIQPMIRGGYLQEGDQITLVGSVTNTDTIKHDVTLKDSKVIVDFGGWSKEIQLFDFGGGVKFLGGGWDAQVSPGKSLAFSLTLRLLGERPKQFGVILTLETADGVTHDYVFENIPLASSKQQLL